MPNIVVVQGSSPVATPRAERTSNSIADMLGLSDLTLNTDDIDEEVQRRTSQRTPHEKRQRRRSSLEVPPNPHSSINTFSTPPPYYLEYDQDQDNNISNWAPDIHSFNFVDGNEQSSSTSQESIASPQSKPDDPGSEGRLFTNYLKIQI